ncbi:AfsR/SARP family transcriptional regulator [Streptomyces iranensis]
MQFRLLGNLRVHAGTCENVSLPPKLRTILAMLIAMHDRIVPVSDIIDELWLGEPPTTAMATIQTYVYQLRKLLGITDGRSVDGVALLTRPSGYMLRVPTESVDVACFEQCFEAAQKAFAEHQYERAFSALGSTEALWGASVLADVDKGQFLDAYAARLEETWTQATELRIDAYLRLGRHLDAIRELKSLTVRHPLHEGFHCSLMVALHRAGRRHEALDTYRRLRRTLANELGIEPSFSVRQLHQRLLAGDPALDGASPAGRFGSTAPVPPAQLPPDIADLVAPESLVAELEQALTASCDSQTTALLSLTGMGGVGKTTLAVRLAHQLRHLFPDGQFFTSLKSGGARPVIPVDALEGFLLAIGIPPAETPTSLEARSQLFRSWCADRRVLLILDDAVSEEQVRPLLPGGPRCAVIVTNRKPLYGLSGARHVELNPLSSEDGLELLLRITGRPRDQEELQAANTIVKLCDNLPMAIRAVGVKLANPTGFSLKKTAARLADKRKRLGELKSGDLDIQEKIRESYQAIGDLERELLRSLSEQSATAFTVQEAAALIGAKSQVEAQLRTIYEARLLLTDPVCSGELRYILPELVRVFVTTQEAPGAATTTCPPTDHLVFDYA